MKKIRAYYTAVSFFAWAFYSPVFSNNILVSNCVLTAQNSTALTMRVKFDISWENSWRVSSAPDNWDAAWIFVKYKAGNGNWSHATLNITGHTAPAGSTIDTPTDGKGVFIYRNSNGIGNVNWPGVELLWNYGVDGVGNNDTIEVCAFAIEMVYVPQGAYYLGDGTTTGMTGQFSQANLNLPFQLTSENALTLGGNSAANLGSDVSSADDFDVSTTQTLPAAFPKGYNAFYCMKYELSQGQYADFLNKLTPLQAGNRFLNANGNFRQTISLAGTYTASAPHRACNYIGWADATAFGDWAALRFMTELEFEKACRGPLVPVPNEYAWGTTTIVPTTTVANDGTATEAASNAGANCVNAFNVQGPLRVGSFATAISNRQQSGATYYGIMEMSGNNWERTITIGNSSGRSYTDTNGDGILDVNGDANVVNWPANTTGPGTGVRGGDWGNTTQHPRVSDRLYAASTYNIRGSNVSCRYVRKAP